MRFFIDTANTDEIREVEGFGILSGVTTNPTLMAKEGLETRGVIQEIADIVDGPISAEVIATKSEEMLTEGRELANIHPNIVVKIPMTKNGMRAVAQLHREGIQTNVTLVFSAVQALVAARAGATYVSPFLGRLDDIGTDGLSLIKDIRTIFDVHNMETEIISASVRHPTHILNCAKAGADIATVPPKLFDQLFNHPLTDSGLEKFLADWNKVNT